MTLISTKYNRAVNWSQRLPLAREIFAEVRTEPKRTLNCGNCLMERVAIQALNEDGSCPACGTQYTRGAA